MTPEELALVLSEGEGYRIEFKEQKFQRFLKMSGITPVLDSRRILKSLAPLRYEFSGFVRAVFLRLIAHGTPQATEQVTEQATEQADSEKAEQVLAFCKEPKSRDEIMKHLGLKHREHFRSDILLPMIESGILSLTIPDKPKSPKQKYVAKRKEGERP
jgi:predicted HTH transcriptional regulator